MVKYFISHLIILSFFFHTHAEEPQRAGFFFQAAALYWQAEEGGLAYAVKSGSSGQLSSHSSVENPKFDWDFGFKVGIGYRVSHDEWNLGLQFTSFQTHTDAEKKAQGEEVFFPIWQTSAVGFDSADVVKMHWRLHLGLIDAKLSKPFYATKSVVLIPELAVRTGWIRQKFNLEYLGGDFPVGENEVIHMKNKFWGIGPMAGLLGEWEIACGFSLFAEGAASLLFGEFYLHQDDDTLGSGERLLGLHDIFRSTAPILEGSAGLRWQHLYAGSMKRVALELCWDQLLFFSQNQLLRFVDAQGHFFSNQGDLSIAGVQLGARFDF
jgi:hypothetical protein